MSLVDDVRRQITDRMRELKPLVDEYHQLEAMIERLKGDDGASAAARPRARRGRAARGASGRRRGRPRGSGTRAAQALELVTAKPGITIPEMGKEMGITPNYLYRVLPELAKEGKVKKQGNGWVPAS
jgi:CRP-like cAMP-binding protein